AFLEQSGPAGQRRPVGVLPDHRAKVVRLHLEAAPVIYLVSFDDALVRMLERPYHSGEYRARHLQSGGVLIRRKLARFIDGELRAVPVGVLLVAIEQHAELIDAVDDLMFVEDVDVVLPLAGLAE